MSAAPDRGAFEAWYVENTLDLAASPLGSRDCALQWVAWRAAVALQQEELRRLRRLSQEWANAALELQTQKITHD